MHEVSVATFLQISDLHFGQPSSNPDDVTLDASLPLLVHYAPWFDGILGHHYKGLAALHGFCVEFMDHHPDDKKYLIITGDLTRNGADAQFDMADGFLNGGYNKGYLPLGLGAADWKNLSVPGNHDHWPGRDLIFGTPQAQLAAYIKNFPIVNDPILFDNGVSLRFIRIDSDSDVNPYLLNRFRARGHFPNQLDQIAKQLGPCPTGEIRILLCHHSLMYRYYTETDQRRHLDPTPPVEMTKRSRRALEKFVVDLGIPIILSGHIHTPSLRESFLTNGTDALPVFEACCGTTTQRDAYTYADEGRINFRRDLVPNSLIVHRLLDRAGAMIWSSQVYWRSRVRGFIPCQKMEEIGGADNAVMEIKIL